MSAFDNLEYTRATCILLSQNSYSLCCLQPILVFVSACNSQKIGQVFIDAGVQHVCCVDVDTRLLDKDAVFFTRHFYMNIIHDCTINSAFQRAKSALSVKANGARSSKFLLLPKNGNHDKRVFENVPALRLMDRPSTWNHAITPPSFPEICENFLGRNLDMSRLLNAILQRSLVTLTGPIKAGKTAVAVALSHFVWKRRQFIGGNLPYYVHFVKLQGVTSTTNAVRTIIEMVLNDMEAIQEFEGPAVPDASTPYYRLRAAHKSVSDDTSRAGLNELIKVLRIVSDFDGRHNILLVRNILFCEMV